LNIHKYTKSWVALARKYENRERSCRKYIFHLKGHEKYITCRLETVPKQKYDAQKPTSDFLQDDRIHRKRSSLLSLSVSSKHINKVF
jgi:hypothetical protein